MLKNNIRVYHQEIIDIIMQRITKNAKEIFIEMASGTGKTIVIEEIVRLFNHQKSILILVENRFVVEQLKNDLQKYQNVVINTYNIDLHTFSNYDYVILNNVERLSKQTYEEILKIYEKAQVICFLDTVQQLTKDEKWLKEKKIDYSLTLQKEIDYGYITPYYSELKFVAFIEKLLQHLQAVDVKKEVALKLKSRVLIADFTAVINGKKALIEVKGYRNKTLQYSMLTKGVEQLEYYRRMWKEENKTDILAVLIMFCEVSDNLKQKIYRDKQILIVDIANLIYLSQDNNELMAELLKCLSYSIDDIIPRSLIDLETSIVDNNDISNQFETEFDIVTKYIQELTNLGYGKDNNNAKKYERICSAIIKYLFEKDFTRVKEQSTTDDRMFNMDLICGIKDTCDFWRMLIQHYNTRFVVFEFKNYENEIDQNHIYITEKYLYNAALRNVAFIISRKGFSPNARKAATGILTENNKLIIELIDNDLISMLRMNADGENPYDYLLNKIEEYLISISK